MGTVGLRADAERNRRQLVDTARVVFAERGLEAPLDVIARRAGVGNATLYRRFPNRCELVAAVFVETLHEVVMATERALQVADPWDAFTGHMMFLCGRQAENRAFADLLTASVAEMPEVERLRARAYAGLMKLIDRAKASGELRADFQHEDVVLVLMANAGLLERTARTAAAAWQRNLSFMLDGLRAPSATRAAPPPGRDGVMRAMRAIAERSGLADTSSR
ncbi:TetR/AcrR family transcriptional regulator [Dactylosporangium fulvum]|uniref:TetR/AcrR family transcriptional regulator n=1 Tax=Dactylosporangium fulvum TaxID=53359 RepID=A0ABY5W0E8_9ACTN|nr:TetR/AcrR family transcriptional regulator [Dactylosporangium fulvum]UWP83512.1 TetR/AcrR family transcriptional regulator [Dactylosporangium fulvum]